MNLKICSNCNKCNLKLIDAYSKKLLVCRTKIGLFFTFIERLNDSQFNKIISNANILIEKQHANGDLEYEFKFDKDFNFNLQKEIEQLEACPYSFEHLVLE